MGKSTFCMKCFLSISNFSCIFFMLIDLSFKQAEMMVRLIETSFIKSNFQVYKYNTVVLHILFLWALLLMPMTCSTVSLKSVLFIFIKISSSHLTLYLCYFLCLFDNWEPGIVSHHCLACIAGENGKHRVQEFKHNVGVLVLLQCISITATPTVHIPKLAPCNDLNYLLHMIHRQAIV